MEVGIPWEVKVVGADIKRRVPCKSRLRYLRDVMMVVVVVSKEQILMRLGKFAV